MNAATAEQLTTVAPAQSPPGEERSSEPVLRELEDLEFAAWDRLVELSPQGSVFCTSWWLKATCGRPRVLGLFERDRLIAGMPLHWETKWGFSACTMPKLTQTWGVVMESVNGKACRITTREMEVLRPFARHLSAIHFFNQCFHPSLSNWLPFHWSGFRQTTRFTYVLNDLTSEERLWKGMTHQIRGQISKAERAGLTVQPCSANEVWASTHKTFDRQRKSVSYSQEYLRTLCDAAETRRQGACFSASDPSGRTHAAGFVVWDARRAYYLVSGADPALRNSGAGSLLAWHIIRFISTRSQVFDFEGTMLEGVERFFRDFGASQTQYNCILKYPAWTYPYLRHAKGL